MKSKHFLLIITLIVLNACKKTESTEKSTTNKHFWEIKNKSTYPVIVKWEQYQNDTIKIKIPIGWRIKKSNESWMFFPYEKNNPPPLPHESFRVGCC